MSLRLAKGLPASADRSLNRSEEQCLDLLHLLDGDLLKVVGACAEEDQDDLLQDRVRLPRCLLKEFAELGSS